MFLWIFDYKVISLIQNKSEQPRKWYKMIFVYHNSLVEANHRRSYLYISAFCYTIIRNSIWALEFGQNNAQNSDIHSHTKIRLCDKPEIQKTYEHIISHLLMYKWMCPYGYPAVCHIRYVQSVFVLCFVVSIRFQWIRIIYLPICFRVASLALTIFYKRPNAMDITPIHIGKSMCALLQ